MIEGEVRTLKDLLIGDEPVKADVDVKIDPKSIVKTAAIIASGIFVSIVLALLLVKIIK